MDLRAAWRNGYLLKCLAVPNKWLERTDLASRRLRRGRQAPCRIARRSATPFGPFVTGGGG